MLIKAEQKYIKMSPLKLRYVLQAIRGVKSPTQAIAYLEVVPKKAALPLSKVLKQAIGNAKNSFSISPEDLQIKEFIINQGSTYKRGQPVSRGRFHRILKETSHIRVILESVEKPKDIKIKGRKEAKAKK